MPYNLLGRDNQGVTNYSLPFPEAIVGGGNFSIAAAATASITAPAGANAVYLEIPVGVVIYGPAAPTGPTTSPTASQTFTEGGIRNLFYYDANGIAVPFTTLYFRGYVDALVNYVWLTRGGA